MADPDVHWHEVFLHNAKLLHSRSKNKWYWCILMTDSHRIKCDTCCFWDMAGNGKTDRCTPRTHTHTRTDTHTHAHWQTHTRTHTDTHTHTHTHTVLVSSVKFAAQKEPCPSRQSEIHGLSRLPIIHHPSLRHKVITKQPPKSVRNAVWTPLERLFRRYQLWQPGRHWTETDMTKRNLYELAKPENWKAMKTAPSVHWMVIERVEWYTNGGFESI